MAVVEWPDGIDPEQDVQCVVCKQSLSILDATIGLLDVDNKPAFACSVHLGLGESAKFLRAWIDFIVERSYISYLRALAQEEGGKSWQESLSNAERSAKI